jgi:hypothetical protein
MEKQNYVVVGECFLAGLMKGEAITASDKSLQLTGPVPSEMIAASILEGCVKTKNLAWGPDWTVPGMDFEQATELVSKILQSNSQLNTARKKFKLL